MIKNFDDFLNEDHLSISDTSMDELVESIKNAKTLDEFSRTIEAKYDSVIQWLKKKCDKNSRILVLKDLELDIDKANQHSLHYNTNHGKANTIEKTISKICNAFDLKSTSFKNEILSDNGNNVYFYLLKVDFYVPFFLFYSLTEGPHIKTNFEFRYGNIIAIFNKPENFVHDFFNIYRSKVISKKLRL